jgi:S1-C subfamily serine protease
MHWFPILTPFLKRHPIDLRHQADQRFPFHHTTLHIALLIGIVLGPSFSPVQVHAQDTGLSTSPTDSPSPGTLQLELDLRRDATVVAIERVLPAVVNISTRSRVAARRSPTEQMIEEFFGYRRQPRTTFSRGSGVVIDPDGHVLTNVHVVGDADEILVQFEDSQEFLKAERVALSQGRDVALLKIQASEPRRFRAIAFANNDDLLLGETVLALGNPFGLGGSVSRGILSAKVRRNQDDSPRDGRLEWQDWLQTDAAINPGNSGGPLINLNGELIGINVAVLRPDAGAQGIGFAIPVRQIKEALAEALSGETVENFWFGARLEPELRPLTIRTIQPGSPAASAGLQPEDVILEIDGEPVRSLIEFNRTLVHAGASRLIPLVVQKNGRTRKLNLRLVRETEFFNEGLIRAKLGLTLRPVRGGLLIHGVESGSNAEARGLRKGMSILGMEGVGTPDILAVAKAIYELPQGDTLELEVAFTEGWTRYRGRVEIQVR